MLWNIDFSINFDWAAHLFGVVSNDFMGVLQLDENHLLESVASQIRFTF
jgi:hypothetical protein